MELGRRTFFDVVRRFTALRLRALASLLLVLERRRITAPKLRSPQYRLITSGICDRRNGVHDKPARKHPELSSAWVLAVL
jgi:hypothetical protein